MTRWWYILLASAVGILISAVAIIALASAIIYPNLPSLDALKDYQPKQPLRIYTEDGALIGEFGEERRAVVRLKDAPKTLPQAILAAEDERFYSHGGVDTLGVLRAAMSNLMSRGVKEGASTITMQVARNFFLSSEKTFTRKMNEALLAIKIEHALSKEEILELYINHIFLGQRAYGFAAAAQIYFGKPLAKITVAEAAMLAGLPKAPSAYNPVVNPTRARSRQLYVLGRMKTLGYISDTVYQQAKSQRLQIKFSPQSFDVGAHHLAELVRQRMFEKYGAEIYVSGMKVFTTLRLVDQKAAQNGVRQGILEFHRRRGYAGPEGKIDLPANEQDAEKAIDDTLLGLEEANGMLPAIVLDINKSRIKLRLRNGDDVELGSSEIKFAQRFVSGKIPENKRLTRGSIVRVARAKPDSAWQLTYLPQVEVAFIALAPANGAVRAMVGGFDFTRNQFNHVTQALRQAGSSFKPFVYSAALERGITPATVFDDAPITVDPAETGGVSWEPKNYDGTLEGPLTLRNALAKSKNLVSIRVLQSTGAQFAQEHIAKFGFDIRRIPPYLTMALGAGEVTPLTLATAYAVFANGGKSITPWHLLRVTDKDGRVLESFTAPPSYQVIDPRNAFITTSLMQDVIRRGTATAALKLGRVDIAGKTGTTNDHHDAWFAGFQPTRVAVAWMGYDKPRPLGSGETGGGTALPIWVRYMEEALRNTPIMPFAMPSGVVTSQIDPVSGMSVEPDQGISEFFYQEFSPGYQPPAAAEPDALTPDLPADTSIPPLLN